MSEPDEEEKAETEGGGKKGEAERLEKNCVGGKPGRQFPYQRKEQGEQGWVFCLRNLYREIREDVALSCRKSFARRNIEAVVMDCPDDSGNHPQISAQESDKEDEDRSRQVFLPQAKG